MELRKGTKVCERMGSFLIQRKRLRVTLGHNSDLPLILLAKRFTTAYYRVLIAGYVRK